MAIKDLVRRIRVEPDQRLVLQGWVADLPWKMQTVMIQGLRAPDTHYCKQVKLVCRWMRSKVLRNADKDHTFMCRKEELPPIDDLENELNYCSMHFTTHFLYALEIIGYKHSDANTKGIAFRYYNELVKIYMHFNVETERQLDIRLEDVDREPEPAACPPEEQDRYLRIT